MLLVRKQTSITFIKVDAVIFIKSLKMYMTFDATISLLEFILKKMSEVSAIMCMAIYMIEKMEIIYVYKIELIKYINKKLYRKHSYSVI